MIKNSGRIFLTILALNIWKASCDFPTDFSNCQRDCWRIDGFVSCVADDFRSSWCCADTHKDCIGRFNFCSLGLQNDDYKFLTCPAVNCPRNNEAMVIYHDSFQKERVDEIRWEWDPRKVAFNCRVTVHADPSLNGKLNV